MDKKQLQHTILSQSYNRDNWITVLRQVFGATKLHSQPRPITIAANDIASNAVELGSFYTKDERFIGIYEITIKEDATTNLAINRVGLRNLLRSIYNYDVDGALIVFVQGNKWRFSYVSEIRTEEGKKQTEPKRYTYLFGEGEICRTAAERFAKLIDKKYYLQDLYEAFSVEKLNKDFFNTYKEFYKKGVAHLVANTQYYQLLYDRKAPDNDDDKKEKPLRDFVKKLLGRIVFLHFLQKKEWLGCTLYNADNFGKDWKKANDDIWEDGSRRFMLDLFNQFPNKEQFHSQCLSVLFFETLNTKREHNVFTIDGLKNKVRVPYLNGGLFDTDITDPTTKKPIETLIDFPSDYFDKLLDFFEQYNFTIDENDPYESEVGIDPEMLGHIFENLLEDNKDRGAFYTPKEIVHYMCQESLIEFLKTHCTKIKANSQDEIINAIQELVRNNRVADILTNKANATVINNLLKNIKVCDPAIGSGAFPMGMLKEIFECRRIIYPYLKTNEDFAPSTIKKEIIQGNIYGVDVENGAVDIARLRFWLALVVDEKKPSPLPNLDFKIMQGNSLLEQFEGIELQNVAKSDLKIVEPQRDLFGNIKEEQLKITFTQSQTVDEIQSLMEEFFTLTDPIKKAENRTKINEYVHNHIQFNVDLKSQQLTRWINELKAENSLNTKQQKKLKEFEKAIQKLEEAQRKLQAIEETNHRPFFLWHIYFNEVFKTNGFDIVIGNPPYIQLQKMGEEVESLENANFKTYTKTADIYCLFYEQGFNLLKPNGVLTYITSNSWMKTKYGELLRKFFVENTSPILIINFEDSKIFQTATVETNILMSKKALFINQVNAVAIKQDYTNDTSILEYKNANEIEINELDSDEWIILSKSDFVIKREIEKDAKRLEDFEIKILSGIKTGFNEGFIISEETKNELIKLDKKNEEIILPIIKGRDIKRYAFNRSKDFIIYSHNGSKVNNISEIDVVNNYPIIYNHLQQFGKEIRNRPSQGKHWTNVQTNYLAEFEMPKIIWGELSDKPKFALDTNKNLVEATVFMLTGDNLKILLTVLNSKLIEWYFETFTTTSGMGTNRWKKYKILKIPIQLPNKSDESKFNIVVDYLIYLNDILQPAVNSFTTNASIAPVFEDVANMMVYELYFTKHMQELDIDVLQFIDTAKEFKPINTIEDADTKKEIIGNCYKWLQQQDNPIRNRVILSNIKSKDIIRRINATTH